MTDALDYPLSINWITYLDPFECSGGGEMTIRTLILAGRRRGHSIHVTAIRRRLHLDLAGNADLYILSNIYNYPASYSILIKKMLQWVVAKVVCGIIKEKSYIHIDNAYVDVCDEHYLPCNGVVEEYECPFKSSLWHRVTGNTRCFRVSTAEMYRHALLNVFLTPLHRQVIQRLLGEEVVGDFYELKPLISPHVFFDRNMQRDIENLFVGVLCEAKGYYEMKQRFPNGNIVLIGKRHRLLKDKGFGVETGPIPYDEIPDYMNRAQNLVFLPRWPEPQGRVVIEAALCGCNLITNENVGAMSWPFNVADPSNYARSAEEFWEVVERIRAEKLRDG